MSKLKIGLTLLFSALGIFGANEYYKPRNIRDLLKWQGIRLASDNKAWKSMFFENEEELKELQIYSESALWTWCSERFKSTNLDDEQTLNQAKKYCADNPISIMSRIIRDGEEGRIIKEGDISSFQINYILTGQSPEVLKLIGVEDKYLAYPPYVATYLDKWCKEQKKAKILSKDNLELFSNFKKRCYGAGVKTVSDLLAKEGVRAMQGTDAYLKRFEEELKNAPQLLDEVHKVAKARKAALVADWEARKKAREAFAAYEDLEEVDRIERAKIDSRIPEGLDHSNLRKLGGQYFKWWCEDQLKESLLKTGIFPGRYAAVKYRCTEKA